jgi:hypothetical protein
MFLYGLSIMSSVRLNSRGAVKQGRHFMILTLVHVEESRRPAVAVDASDMTPSCLSEQYWRVRQCPYDRATGHTSDYRHGPKATSDLM